MRREEKGSSTKLNFAFSVVCHLCSKVKCCSVYRQSGAQTRCQIGWIKVCSIRKHMHLPSVRRQKFQVAVFRQSPFLP